MKKFRPFFVHSIQKHYPNNAKHIIEQTDAHYVNISIDTKFASTSPNPIDRRLDFCAYFLALIKTLDAQSESFQNIRTICIEITSEYVKPKNKFQAWLKRLIPKMTHTWLGQSLIQKFQEKVKSNPHPEGFIAHIITDKTETFGLGYGVDIIECGICKLFTKHHYGKYASILCEVDEITSALAGLQLIRHGTIANGAKKCDFRFSRIN